MKLKGILWLLLLVVTVLVLARPKSAWTEMKRSWARREWIVTMLLIAIAAYFLYGVYTMYTENTLQRLQELWQ